MLNRKKNERENPETKVSRGWSLMGHELVGFIICSGNRVAKSKAIAEK